MTITIVFRLALLSLYSGGCLVLSCADNDIRLVGTPSLYSEDKNVGRVEVCVGGRWGTITLKSSLNFWTDKNVQVACRQLGFSGGLNSIPPINITYADKSPSNLSIHYEDIACNGQELMLTSCTARRSGKGTSPNAHHKDVFIVCRPRTIRYSDLHTPGQHTGDIRLFGDLRDNIGAVEIFTGQNWTGICPDSSWSVTEARIICQALGYDFGVAKSIFVRNSNIDRSIYDGKCSDTTSLSTDSSRVNVKRCSFREVQEPDDCAAATNMYAGVECRTASGSSEVSIRPFGIGLIDQERAVGVVELFYNNRWGVVCRNHMEEFDKVTAELLCEGFSFDRKKATFVQLSPSSLSMHESNLKPLWINGIVCSSNVTHFADCEYAEPLGYGNCSVEGILAVDCGSTKVSSDNSVIIISIVVAAFVFVFVTLILGKIFYNMCVKKSWQQQQVEAINPITYYVETEDVVLQNADNTSDNLRNPNLDDEKLANEIADGNGRGNG